MKSLTKEMADELLRLIRVACEITGEPLNDKDANVVALRAIASGECVVVPLAHPRPRETAAESLSVDSLVADLKDALQLLSRYRAVADGALAEAEEHRKDAARYRWLREHLGFANVEHTNGWCQSATGKTLDNVVDGGMKGTSDAAMSADVRSPDFVSPAPSAVAQWQPIESAPRDGTKILLWRDGWDGAPIGRWAEHDGDDGWFYGWALDFDGYHGACCEEAFIGWQEDIDDGHMPTHWQPRPDVRSQAKDTQGREPLVSDDHDEIKGAAKRLRGKR